MKRFITGGILAIGLILPMQATAWSGSIFGGTNPFDRLGGDLAVSDRTSGNKDRYFDVMWGSDERGYSGSIFGGLTGNTGSHTIVRPPHVRPPSNNTSTIVAALTDAGGTGASGVCCSDLPAQQSEVLIASGTPGQGTTTPPNIFGGDAGDGARGDYDADGNYAGPEMGGYGSSAGEGSFGGDADGHGGMF